MILVVRDQTLISNVIETISLSGGVDVRIREADLADPEAPKRIFEQIQAWNLSVSCLVNNAGIGDAGHFHT